MSQRRKRGISRLCIYTIFQTNNHLICVDILMRCDVNSIFDCAGVLICTPSNQKLKFASRSQNRPQIKPISFSPSNITPILHFKKITKKHKFALTIIPENGIINVTGNADYVCHPHGKTRVIIQKIPANFIRILFSTTLKVRPITVKKTKSV